MCRHKHIEGLGIQPLPPLDLRKTKGAYNIATPTLA